MRKWSNYLATILFLISFMSGYAQGPDIWIFGRNAGLNLTTGQPVPASYTIDNCYSPTSVQCDQNGGLLFYYDGRVIRDRNGQVMTGSENPVWPAPMHNTLFIVSNIVPVPGNTDKYYVFTVSPSSGIAPFGTYYSGVLTMKTVDMKLNNGMGGIDFTSSLNLLDTELNRDILVVPGSDCSHWLILYQQGTPEGRFLAYKISDQGIAGPVYSPMNIPGTALSFRITRFTYAYRSHKILARASALGIFSLDFDPLTGNVSNGNKLLDLGEFRNQGGGITFPSLCLSPDEQFLYLLGYPPTDDPNIKLQQYPVDLSLTTPTIGASTTLFQTYDALYQISATSLPLHSADCDIRQGPDGKVYMFYHTGMSFLGLINKPNNAGAACDFIPQGVQLLPNTYGSHYFPPVENKRPEVQTNYFSHDTLLCITGPIVLKTGRNGGQYTFTWNDGSTDPTLTVNRAGVYWVKSKGDCTEPQHVDTFIVRSEPAEQCNCNLFVPNAFSPNSDHLNDIFRPSIPLSCISGSYVLTIYNRWGASIFHSFQSLNGWDGTINGQKADLGVYHYTISYRDVHSNTVSHKGSFTLLR